jgi:hypothetical protein
VALQQGLHPLPDRWINSGEVRAGMDLVLVPHLADIGRIGQKAVQDWCA